jgi:hypothetical protein
MFATGSCITGAEGDVIANHSTIAVPYEHLWQIHEIRTSLCPDLDGSISEFGVGRFEELSVLLQWMTVFATASRLRKQDTAVSLVC